MHPGVLGRMALQHGLVTRPQILAVGISAEQADRWARTGALFAVRRGVYTEPATWAALERWEDRRLMRDRAASLRIRADHVMSHTSAALELGLPILKPADELTHVTYRGVTGTRHPYGVKHHLAPYSPEQVVEVAGRRVLGPARTAVDITRHHGLTAGVVACDSALQAGASKADLRAVTEAMWCWPQSRAVREAIALADPGAESVGETLTRLLVTELGHGRPQTQFSLADGRREAWCDLRLGRHVVEFDGRVKYHRGAVGGIAGLDADEVVWREKQRQDFVCGFKLGMSRVVWADLFGDARRQTLARLRREYDDTCARFGTDIADLAAYRVNRPRHRAR